MREIVIRIPDKVTKVEVLHESQMALEDWAGFSCDACGLIVETWEQARDHEEQQGHGDWSGPEYREE